MGEYSVQTLRADVRGQFKGLAKTGLGTMVQTASRDAFVLAPAHPGAAALAANAGVHDNFIRSEAGGLLFRDPSDVLLQAFDPRLLRRAKTDGSKGVQFAWGSIDKPDLRRLFEAVRQVAALGGA